MVIVIMITTVVILQCQQNQNQEKGENQATAKMHCCPQPHMYNPSVACRCVTNYLTYQKNTTVGIILKLVLPTARGTAGRHILELETKLGVQ